jgi:hypothetical protein
VIKRIGSRGPIPKYDYEALYEEFVHARSIGKVKTLGEFAALSKLNKHKLSQRFSEIKRDIQMKEFRRKNPALLLAAQRNIIKALETGNKDNDYQARISLEALKIIADREGLSPQANIINVKAEATTATGIFIAPMFSAKQDNDDLKSFFGGDANDNGTNDAIDDDDGGE